MRHRMALVGLAAGNILMGLLYTLAVIRVRGVGAESDAYFFTLAIATFFLAIFSVPIGNVVTALLAKSRSPDDWRALAWAGHASALLVYLPIAVVLSLTAGFWIGVLLPGGRNDDLYRQLVPLQMSAMLFAGIQTSALAALQSRKRFIIAELVLFGTAAVFYFPFVARLASHGVVAAAEVQLGRSLVQLLLFLGMAGIPVWRNLRPVMAEVMSQFRLPVLGGAYYKTDALLDRYLLAHSKDGLMSVYHLVQQVIAIISTLYARSFIAPLLVAAAEDVGSRKGEALRQRINAHMKISLYIMAAGVFSVLAVRAAAVPLGQVFRFPPELIVSASALFLALGGVLLGGLMGQAVNTVFYATGRLSTPVWVGVSSYTVFVPLKIAGFFLFGITGLSLVASLYYLVNAAVLFKIQSRLLEEYS